MNPETKRLFFIDWLRVIALAILWVYHTALIFNGTVNFHIMNAQSIPYLYDVLYFFHQWRLSLLFLVSGIGTYFAIKKYNSGFIKERAKRLLIPLIFGILVIIPPQIYFERRYQGFYFDSYLQFYLQSFGTGLYPYGNISWHHLWFMAYLFIYGIIVYYTYRIFQRKKEWMYRRVSPWMMVMPLIIAEILLKPYSPGVQNIVQDLAMFVFYLFIYLYGIVFSSHREYFHTIEKYKNRYLLLAIFLTFLIYLSGRYLVTEHGQFNLSYYVKIVFSAAHRWFTILAITGYAIQYLNKENRIISVINPAVLPLYMLHQTFIIVIGYFVIQAPAPPVVKLLLIVLVSMGISVLLYFYVIKRIRWLRILFGISKK